MLREGDPAPDFTLESDAGERVSLADFRGKPVVLYFYPKDDTPGCTTQACGIRDAYGEFERAGAVVLGVSPDSVAKHVKFRDKYGASVHAPRRHRARGRRALRRLGREEVHGPDVHGRRSLDVRGRGRRDACQGAARREAGDARRRRARRSRLLVVEAKSLARGIRGAPFGWCPALAPAGRIEEWLDEPAASRSRL